MLALALAVLLAQESPAEALLVLAHGFCASGKSDAQAETLRFLVDRYPTSRGAEKARLALANAAAVTGSGCATLLDATTGPSP